MRPPDLSSPDRLLADAREALLHGHTDEARALCGRVVRVLGAPAVAERRPHAACAAFRLEARAHAIDGDLEASLDSLAAAAAVAAALDDATELGQTLNNLATVHLQHGDLDAATSIYAAASLQADRACDRRLGVQIAINRGIVANIRGDLAEAEAHYAGALDPARALGMQREVAAALNNLGQVQADRGRWDDAERSYRECARVATALEDLDTLTLAHVNLAEVWVGRGDLARATEACERAMATSLRAGTTTARGEVHRQLGVVTRERGALDEAAGHFAEAAAVATARGDLLLLAETAREQADLFRRQGHNRDTLQMLNRAHALFTRLRARRDLADVSRRMGRLEEEFVAVARRWGESIEAKDRYTQGHCQRVADLACRIAEHAGSAHGFDGQALFWFRIGALLHDVGKLDIPEEVLNKPGKLTDAEWSLMRGHTTAGVALLAGIEFPWDIRPIVESHHERWDGRGYPHGLAGPAIPLPARVLAVADVYDALTSVRSYKRAMTHAEACAILAKDAGTAFDPQVVEWFTAVAPEWEAQLEPSGPVTSAAAPEVAAQCRALGHDEVTGLPGRQAFFAECARVLAARAADGRPTSLLLVTLGSPGGSAHPPADAVLQTVADALSRNTRGSDFIVRYARHEFLVLLPDLGADEAQVTAERLREVVVAALAAGGAPAPALHVAFGSAPPASASPELLLAVADAARRRDLGARGGRSAHAGQHRTAA